MFTGIIESMALVTEINPTDSNIEFTLQSPIASEFKVDQSVSHNGVCLTVVWQNGELYKVQAVDETLKKSNLGSLSIGDKVNIERAMKLGDRLDGHMVQGHVDTIGKCLSIIDLDGSWQMDFEYQSTSSYFTVEKGSICINGVSLTVFNSDKNAFSVAIIPYTFKHTTFNSLKPGDSVNLEFDLIGKYIQKLYTANQ